MNNTQNYIKLDGIDIKLTRKRIKNAYIYVKPPNGEVSMSIPIRMSLAEAERFIISKQEWIIKNRLKILERPQSVNREKGDGDTIYIWGRPYILSFVEDAGRNGYEISEIFVKLSFKNEYDRNIRDRLLKSMYASLLKERLAVRLPIWEERTGLKCNSWSVRYMTSRWGSCNTRSGKLNFNTQLAERQTKYLDYVILHELAHTKAANHGERFKAILDEYMDDWRILRKELNRG